MRKCNNCKINKPLEEFALDKSRPLGYAYRCKECVVIIYKEKLTRKEANKIEIDLPLNVRIFYKIVHADFEVQAKILEEVEAASKQRDALIQILTQPIV